MKAKIGGEVGYNPVVASEQKIEALYGLLENWAPTAHALPKVSFPKCACVCMCVCVFSAESSATQLINKMKYISVLSRDAGELDSRLRGGLLGAWVSMCLYGVDVWMGCVCRCGSLDGVDVWMGWMFV